MELIVVSNNTYSKHCLGAQRHNKEVMLTFSGDIVTEGKEFHDIFMTNEQAEELRNQLNNVLEQNKKD